MCNKHHRESYHTKSHTFLNLDQSVQTKGGDKETDLENLIDSIFYHKITKEYCKTCRQVVVGRHKRDIKVLPKTLIIVVDRMTFKGALRNLLTSFPEVLDLSQHYKRKKNDDLPLG